MLCQIRIVEYLGPRSGLADPAGHDPGIKLSPRVNLAEAETKGELAGIWILRGFEESVAGFPQLLFDGSVSKLAGKPGQHETIASIIHADISIPQ